MSHTPLNFFLATLPANRVTSTEHMPGNHNEIEKRLWDAADELRANSALKSAEYSVPVLGFIFLRYADQGKDRSKEFKMQDLTALCVFV